MEPGLIAGGGARPTRRRHALLTTVAVALAALVLGIGVRGPEAPTTAAANRAEVRILAGGAATLDPAAEGDSASAAVTAQLFETLTAIDPGLNVRPALAEAWDVSDGGRRIVFRLRPGLSFSDGTPLTATDVVRSWLRVIDPAAPSPLASLMDDVSGAAAYRKGEARDASTVGIRAIGDDQVDVRLEHPASDFVAIVTSPTFGIVPPGVGHDASAFRPGTFVSSGAYRLIAQTPSEMTLQANDRYWAGRPAIGVVHLVTDIGGRSPVDAFQNGDLDYAPISDYDASWIAYNRDLGPQLRSVPSLSVTYYGFDTSRPPFDDVRVRRAFAEAVDWTRLVNLGNTGTSVPADAMVPPGTPDRPAGSFMPSHDPAGARALLAAAGFPGGRGFPAVTMLSGGWGYEEAIVDQLQSVLGVTVRAETMASDEYFLRLPQDPPAIWSMSWIADYPGANDFLGLLLGSDQPNNYGRWRSPAFDAAIAASRSASDPAVATAAYGQAETIVASDVPVIPVEYGTGWVLSRTGLLGAGQNGLGILRMAGLAWAP